MNHFYRSIWNKKTGNFVAVSENTKSCGKSASGSEGTGTGLTVKALAASMAIAFSAPAWAEPTGGVVTAGTATVTKATNSTTIHQTSQNVSLNWTSFNIGAGESVRFVQPNSQSVALNRVLGSDPTSILGSLTANGKVFLVNPNGILFGKGASVNVGGLVASTLDVSDSDVASGKYRFAGNSSAGVVNQGSISAADGGYVALLGASVSNQGVISARLGTVALAAGEAVTLDVAGDGLVNVTVDKGALKALADNGGLLQADGGQVLMTSRSAGSLLNTAVNNTGVIQAQTIDTRGGTIKLLGDMQNGVVNVGGTLDASAPDGGDGGFIDTSAATVAFADKAKITTNAPLGKTGNWLIDPVDFNIAATGGNMTGAFLSNALGSSSVTIMSSSGNSGTAGNVNVNDTVSWSANRLTLNAHADINVNKAMTASGTASLALEYAQGNSSGRANIMAPVSLPSGLSLFKKNGSSTAIGYTVINSLGTQGSMTGTDLQGMSGNLGGNYALGSTIDASATATWNNGAGFAPVGSGGTWDGAFSMTEGTFTGRLDGMGNTITNLVINRPNQDYVGLIGSAFTDSISNVSLTDARILGRHYVGALAGQSHFARIFNSHVYGGTVYGGGQHAGGLVGRKVMTYLWDSSSSATVAGRDHVGGLVGSSFMRSYNSGGTPEIANGSASGTVTGSGENVGGLLGSGENMKVGGSYATGTVRGKNSAGGLIGNMVNGIVSTSYAGGDVTSNFANAGGLIGQNTAAVSNAYATGKVIGQTSSGGLIGLHGGGAVTNTYATGAVQAIQNSGGLIGNLLSGTVDTSYATGAVTGTSAIGGLVGLRQFGTVNNSYWNTETTGRATSAGGTGLTNLAMSSTTAWTGFNFTTTPGASGNNWVMINSNGSLNGSVQGVTGTRPMLASEYSTTLRNSHELQLVSMALGANYTVAQDIDMRATASSNVWGTQGFVPIGVNYISEASPTNGLSGTFDGQGKVIFGLYSDRTRNNVGLFAKINAAGVVKNTALISGLIRGTTWVGALAGDNAGTITQSYSNLDVTGTGYGAGGLVGKNSGAITLSNATGFVNGGSVAGGLVGENSGLVDSSYASGGVGASTYAGGLVGADFAGTISNSYATRGAFSNSYGGGLVGRISGSKIINTYASGPVIGYSGAGGLFGEIANYSHGASTVSASYWDKDVHTLGYGAGSATAGMTGLSSAEMQTASNFAGFNFTGTPGALGNNWVIINTNGTLNNAGGAAGATRPMLASEYATSIRNAHQLQLISMNLGGHYTLFNSIDASATNFTRDVWTTAGFVPLGIHFPGPPASSYASFTGTFDGGMRGISNLRINAPTGVASGLFTHIGAGATVKNLTLSGGGVTGGTMVGALAGVNAGTIANVQSTMTVSGQTSVGGLVGINQGAIDNTYSSAVVSGVTNVGGLVASSINGTVSNSYATGAVTASGNGAGGLASYVSGGLINNVYASGSVAGASTAGGLIGERDAASPGTVSNAFWNTTVRANGIGAGEGTGMTGLTSAGMRNEANFSGFNFANPLTGVGNNWVLFEGRSAPLLRSFMSRLTVVTAGDTKTYDQQAYAATGVSTYSITPTRPLAGTLSYGGTAQGAVNAGDYTITAGGLHSNQLGYYIDYVQGVVTVDKRVLNLSGATAAGKVYDGTRVANVNGANATISAALAGDSVTLAGVSGLHTDSSVMFGNSVVISGVLAGASAGNYSAVQAGWAPASISRKQVTLNAAVSKVYDGTVAHTTTAANLAALTAQLGVAKDSVTGATIAFNNKDAGTGKTTTISGLTISDGYGGGNYTISYGQAPASTITPKALTVSGVTAANKVYDGSTAAAVNAAGAVYSGLVAGDSVFVSGAGTFADRNAGNAKAVTLALTGTTPGNYVLAGQTSTTANITPKAVILNAPEVGKTYDGTVSATATAAQLAAMSTQLGVSGDSVSGVTLAFADKNAGTNKTVNASAATVSDGNGGNNYTLSYTASSTSSITAKALTASAVAAGKTYDGTNVANASLTLSGLVGTETLGASAAATFNSKDVLAANLVTVNGVTLANGSNGGLASNYTLAAGQTAAASISAKALTASATATGKTYDGTTAANATLAITGGLVGSETVGATGSATFNSKDVLTANLVTVNSATLVNGSNGGLASNYTLAAGQTAAASISAKALTASATAAGKTYDGNNVASASLVLNGLVGAETLATSNTATFNSKDVATANLVTVNSVALANGSNGGLASNYTLAAGQTAAASIGAKALTASATAAGKTYDGTTAASATLAITGGLVGSETVGATGTATFNSKDVLTANQVTVNSTTLVSGSNGGLASNYTLAAGQTAAASVSAKALTASAAAAGKTYDGNNVASASLALNGLVGAETLGTSNTATFNSKDAATANLVTVNSVALANGSNGGLASNYTLAAGQTAAASISAKALTASATAAGKSYDGNTTAATTLAITGGLVGAETVTATGAGTFNSKDVLAANLVTVNSVALANGSNGGLASNYTLAAGQTAAAAIGAKALTASATASGKTYDGTTAASATLAITGGLVGSETVGATGSATFNSKDVLTANQVTVNSTTLVNGSNGGLASNYTLAAGQTAAASISAKGLTASATAAGKTYDGNNVASASLALNGLVGAETLATSNTATFNSKDVATANLVTVNSVALANGSNGGLASNYTLAAGQTAAASISAKALTASATAAGKTYDGYTTAAATLAITGGLVGAETVTATGTGTFNSKDVLAANHVTVNSVALANGSNGGLASNYTLAAGQTAAAAIGAKALTASATAAGKTYDGSTAANGTLVITGGLVGSETVGAAGSATFNSKDVLAANQVTVNSTTLADGSNGGLASNYTLAAGQTASAAITPKALQVTGLVAANKVYDGNTSATVTGGALQGLVGTETLTLTGPTGSFADKHVGVNKTVNLSTVGIANGTGLASNYTVAQPAALTASITRLASATWVGGTTGSWFDAANWAGGAVPDLANVANVNVPAGVTISFNGSAPVNVDTIFGGGTMSVAGGSLKVANGVQLDTLNQSGGALAVTGNVAVANATLSGGALSASGNLTATSSFNQTGGSVTTGGAIAITQPTGSVSLGNISAGGTLNVNTVTGNINQVAGTVIAAARNSELIARAGDVALTGNNSLPEPIIASGNLDVRQVAIGNAITATSGSAAAAPSEDERQPVAVRGSVVAALDGANVEIVGAGIRLPGGSTPGEDESARK